MQKLQSINWAELKTAYGSAENIPILLTQLEEFPQGEQYEEEPWLSLWSSLCHQGDIYSASLASVPFILDVISRDPSRVSFNYFALPTAIEIARVENNIAIPIELADAYKAALTKIPALAQSILQVGCNEVLLQSILSAIAVSVGNIGYAKLIIEIDGGSISEALAWLENR